MTAVAAAGREADPALQALDRDAAAARMSTIPRIASIGWKSAASSRSSSQLERLAVVGVHQQPLLDVALAGEAALEPQLQALQRQHAPAGQRQRRVRQLVHRLRARAADATSSRGRTPLTSSSWPERKRQSSE